MRYFWTRKCWSKVVLHGINCGSMNGSWRIGMLISLLVLSSQLGKELITDSTWAGWWSSCLVWPSIIYILIIDNHMQICREIQAREIGNWYYKSKFNGLKKVYGDDVLDDVMGSECLRERRIRHSQFGARAMTHLARRTILHPGRNQSNQSFLIWILNIERSFRYRTSWNLQPQRF